MDASTVVVSRGSWPAIAECRRAASATLRQIGRIWFIDHQPASPAPRIALLLAAVGIYSMVSYIVRGRSREIGTRTALGARQSNVLRLVIVEGMSPAPAGIAAGMGAAPYGSTR